ncbi:MAG: hypothetical protein J3K34DRAFT_228091 [Monoraphidium minutum]|nr:MAG: hypothetical protein J3K34DRAFT_228091 [Monoraphidium minutum]
MNSFVAITIALLAVANGCSAARPLAAAGAGPSWGSGLLRRLHQYYADDPALWAGPGPKIQANMHYSRMSPDAAKSLIIDRSQDAARRADTDFLTDTQASMTMSRQNFGALKDLLNQEVQSAATNAPANEDAAAPNAVAMGTTSVWTTAVLPTSELLRKSMAQDLVQGATQVALDGPSTDVFRLTKTGQAHAETIAMPTGWFNWRRMLRH